jgi:hypothetical protein
MAASIPNSFLLSLPNELLLSVLSNLSTPLLTPVAHVSHRFASLVYRLVLYRLKTAAELPGHTLLLECYHPSAKLTEPYLYCLYKDAPELKELCDQSDSGENSTDVDLIERFRQLRKIYARYTVYRHHPNPLLPRRHPAGDVPGSRTYNSTSASTANSSSAPALTSQTLPESDQDEEDETVRQMLHLDSHELFTQLCTTANLVKIGPRSGLFRCFVGLEEGVIRVFREWLSRMAQVVDNDGNIRMTLPTSDIHVDSIAGDKILWLTPQKHVGLRFKVRERRIQRRTPVLWYAEEEVAVSYEIEYEGMYHFYLTS